MDPETSVESGEFLICLGCSKPFRYTEVGLPRRLLRGDCYYELRCLACSTSGNMEYHRIRISWLQAVYLVFYHLAKSYPEQKYFRWKETVCTLFDEYWDDLMPEKQRTPTWNNTIASCISTHPHIFKSGQNDTGQPGNWTLCSFVTPKNANYKNPPKSKASKGLPGSKSTPKVKEEAKADLGTTTVSDSKKHAREFANRSDTGSISHKKKKSSKPKTKNKQRNLIDEASIGRHGDLLCDSSSDSSAIKKNFKRLNRYTKAKAKAGKEEDGEDYSSSYESESSSFSDYQIYTPRNQANVNKPGDDSAEVYGPRSGNHNTKSAAGSVLQLGKYPTVSMVLGLLPKNSTKYFKVSNLIPTHKCSKTREQESHDKKVASSLSHRNTAHILRLDSNLGAYSDYDSGYYSDSGFVFDKFFVDRMKDQKLQKTQDEHGRVLISETEPETETPFGDDYGLTGYDIRVLL